MIDMEAQGLLFVMILSLVVSKGYCDYGVHCNCKGKINRRAFPNNFVFGASSSAYQFEGAYDIDGKGPSIWDRYTHEYPGKIADLSNGDVAVDSYHKYKDDVACAKNMNLDAYRFSIAWSRILPYGPLKGGVINQKGIDYYNNLINETIARGLIPYVTLFHWDVPAALEESYGGFLNSRIVEDFNTYANVCFANFGDRVKNWITFNEPWSFSNMGYGTGSLAPFRCSEWQRLGCLGGDSGTEPYWASHHQLLAHAAAVNTYRTLYQPTQQGRIGITLVSQYFEPYSNTSDDYEAQQRSLDFALGWFLHPITYGDYPLSMRYLVGNRLPDFTPNDTALLKGSYDFLGLNYYTTTYAINAPNSCGTPPSYLTDPQVNHTSVRDGVPIGKEEGGWLYIYPRGIRGLLKWIKKNYKNPSIIITENGVCTDNDESLPLAQQLNDTIRVNYIKDHLCCIKETIYKDKVNVEGYIAWSLMDNFEWASGYNERFGLYYVDYQSPNLTRIPKVSAKWFKKILNKKKAYYLPQIADQ